MQRDRGNGGGLMPAKKTKPIVTSPTLKLGGERVEAKPTPKPRTRPRKRLYKGPLGRPWKPEDVDLADWDAARDRTVWARRWERGFGFLIDHYGLDRADPNLWFKLAAHLASDHVPLVRDHYFGGRGRPRVFNDEQLVAIQRTIDGRPKGMTRAEALRDGMTDAALPRRARREKAKQMLRCYDYQRRKKLLS